MDKKLWSGRFRKVLDPRVEVFNASIAFDQRLYQEDIEGSIAHARMLGEMEIIRKEEALQIIEGLKGILGDIQVGKVNFSSKNEDIHMNMEVLLQERIGDMAKKLHTARSRNDQVALDMRLYLREGIKDLMQLIGNLNGCLGELCQMHQKTYMPGYTHLQKAQPITLAMHLGAYVAMFFRDRGRLADCLVRMNRSPLGAGALAGTSLKTDRKMVAEELGFDGVIENTLDAVSDRDYLIEFLSAGSIIGMHLSRFSEELILWATEEFDFIELDDAFATGSSLMPQKKNPDVPELIRGKTGRLYGHLVSVLTMMKGLPLAYNKDMQEDKEAMFDVLDTLVACIEIIIPFLRSIKFNKEIMYKAADKSFICATAVVDYLIKRNVSFRNAHEIVGQLVQECISRGLYLRDLELEVFKEYSEVFEGDVYDCLKIENVIKR